MQGADGHADLLRKIAAVDRAVIVFRKRLLGLAKYPELVEKLARANSGATTTSAIAMSIGSEQGFAHGGRENAAFKFVGEFRAAASTCNTSLRSPSCTDLLTT